MPHPFINTGELLSQHGNHVNGNYVFVTFVDSEGGKEKSVQGAPWEIERRLFHTFRRLVCRSAEDITADTSGNHFASSGFLRSTRVITAHREVSHVSEHKKH